MCICVLHYLATQITQGMSRKHRSKHHTYNPQHQMPTSTTGTPQEHANTKKSDLKCNYQPPPEKKLIWGMTIFERIIALLTFLALVATIFTGVFIRNQWREMKVDQRPWFNVDSTRTRFARSPSGSVEVTVPIVFSDV